MKGKVRVFKESGISLATYVSSYSEDDGALYNMLVSFYAYCYEANVYMNRGVIPPYIESLPPIDVNYR